MFKYTKVRTHSEKGADNEVRVSNSNNVRNYLRYINGLFEEKKFDTIILKGMGFVISKCLAVADRVRRMIKDMNGIVEFGSMEIEDTFEPDEEGLDIVKIKKKVPIVTVKLSTKPLDSKHPGYLEPANEKDFEPWRQFNGSYQGGFEEGEEGEYRGRGFRGGRRGGFGGGRRGGRFRGGSRGGYREGGYEHENRYDEEDYGGERPRSERRGFRGRGRGRGRRFRGEGRGFRGEGRDFGGEGREYRGERRGFRGEGRDFGGEGREYRGERRSFRGEGRGFRGEGRGFRGEGRGFRGEGRGFRGEGRGIY